MKISFSKNDLTIVIFGLAIRIGIALVSNHPYDTAQFAIAQRLFFQHGIVELKYFPTLPLLYYVQLPFYSIYTLLQILGLSDYQEPFRSIPMIEGVFLKLPLMLSDVGGFWVIRTLTQKRVSAMLYFFNPFVIYLSSAWGMYDTLMVFPLLAGFLLLQKYGTTRASVAFVFSGMVKLLGFIPFSFLVVESLLRKRFKDARFQILSGAIVAGAIMLPVVFVGGIQVFLVGFLLRFVGLGDSVQGYYNYNPLGILLAGSRSGAASPSIIPGVGLQAVALFLFLAYLIEARHFRAISLTVLAKWVLIGAILLNIFAPKGEVEWLSWVIPLGIVYGFLSNRTGLQYFTFVYGTTAAFVAMLYTQGTGYLLGIGLDFLPAFQAITNGLEVYAMTTLSLLLLALAYTLYRPVKFRYEIIGAVVLIYLQTYFWFGLVGVRL